MSSYLVRFASNGQMENRYFSVPTAKEAVNKLIGGGEVSKDEIIAVYQYVPNSEWN